MNSSLTRFVPEAAQIRRAPRALRNPAPRAQERLLSAQQNSRLAGFK